MGEDRPKSDSNWIMGPGVVVVLVVCLQTLLFCLYSQASLRAKPVVLPHFKLNRHCTTNTTILLSQPPALKKYNYM